MLHTLDSSYGKNSEYSSIKAKGENISRVFSCFFTLNPKKQLKVEVLTLFLYAKESLKTILQPGAVLKWLIQTYTNYIHTSCSFSFTSLKILKEAQPLRIHQFCLVMVAEEM